MTLGGKLFQRWLGHVHVHGVSEKKQTPVAFLNKKTWRAATYAKAKLQRHTYIAMFNNRSKNSWIGCRPTWLLTDGLYTEL